MMRPADRRAAAETVAREDRRLALSLATQLVAGGEWQNVWDRTRVALAISYALEHALKRGAAAGMDMLAKVDPGNNAK